MALLGYLVGLIKDEISKQKKKKRPMWKKEKTAVNIILLYFFSGVAFVTSRKDIAYCRGVS